MNARAFRQRKPIEPAIVINGTNNGSITINNTAADHERGGSLSKKERERERQERKDKERERKDKDKEKLRR